MTTEHAERRTAYAAHDEYARRIAAARDLTDRAGATLAEWGWNLTGPRLIAEGQWLTDELTATRTALADARTALADARAEIAEARAAITDARAAIAEARAEIARLTSTTPPAPAYPPLPDVRFGGYPQPHN